MNRRWMNFGDVYERLGPIEMRRSAGTAGQPRSKRAFDRDCKAGLVPEPQRDSAGHRFWTPGDQASYAGRLAALGLPRKYERRQRLGKGRAAAAARAGLVALCRRVPPEAVEVVRMAIERACYLHGIDVTRS